MEHWDFTIIHEDEHLCIVDKPAGLLAVPISNSSVTNLYDQVAAYYAERDPKVRVGCVHRIDRYTSGLMAFTKHHEAYLSVRRQFMDHSPDRCYLALVRGVMEEDKGRYSHHLKRIKEGFRNIVCAPDEKGAAEARLSYQVLERFLSTTMVEVYLDTGLKNQIRVQFEAEGHQLVGDRHYAPEEEEERLLNRQALHACRLGFRHPATGKKVTFEAPLPADLLRLIDHYRWRKKLLG